MTPIENKVRAAATALLEMRRRGGDTQEAQSRYFEVVEQLPIPNFIDHAEQERVNKTQRYQTTLAKVRVKIGLRG